MNAWPAFCPLGDKMDLFGHCNTLQIWRKNLLFLLFFVAKNGHEQNQLTSLNLGFGNPKRHSTKLIPAAPFAGRLSGGETELRGEVLGGGIAQCRRQAGDGAHAVFEFALGEVDAARVSERQWRQTRQLFELLDERTGGDGETGNERIQ